MWFPKLLKGVTVYTVKDKERIDLFRYDFHPQIKIPRGHVLLVEMDQGEGIYKEE